MITIYSKGELTVIVNEKEELERWEEEMKEELEKLYHQKSLEMNPNYRRDIDYDIERTLFRLCLIDNRLSMVRELGE